MYDLLKELIKPELLVLVPVLYLVGIGIKKSGIKDKWIPFILGGMGIFAALIYLLAVNSDFSWQGIFMVIFMAITQGVLCSGASVYVNQLIKQAGKEE